MNTLHRCIAALQQGLRQGASSLLRVAVAVTAMVFALFVLFAGLLVGAGLVGWALLRGRRPVFAHFGTRAGQPGKASRESRFRREVIDVEAREVAPEKTY